MNTNGQPTVEIALDDLINVLDLANRLVNMGYTSRIEGNFIRNMTQNISNALNQQKNVEGVDETQNNKVDENNDSVIP